MAKFKKGDRVRVVYPNYVHTGKECTIVNITDWGSMETDLGDCWGCESSLELLTEYTPITPKVGERYRVLKSLYRYLGRTSNAKGIVTVSRVDRDGDVQFKETRDEVYLKSCFTTEYLELVEEEEGQEIFTDTGFKRWSETYPADFIKEPIKKTIIQKTMNAFKKALLSADTKTLIKAGYLYEDSLELTPKGQQALNFIVYEKYQKELVAAAVADIKEEEAKK